MKKQTIVIVLTLCLCIFSQSVAYAWQGDSVKQENVPMEESTGKIVTYVVEFTQTDIYNAIIAMKEKYPDGMAWTNDEPYGANCMPYNRWYDWNGIGYLTGRGCAAFAYELNDVAFGMLPSRLYATSEYKERLKDYSSSDYECIKGEVKFEDIRVGDVLRINNNSHSVIVLEVNDDGVVTAEGNVGREVHWGNKRSKDEVMSSIDYYYTRYPESNISPEGTDATGSSASSYVVEFTQKDVHNAMTKLDKYEKGEPWTENEFYRSKAGVYIWNGTHEAGTGSSAYAYGVSDSIFGSLPARKYVKGEFKYEDIRVGDILRLDNDTHSVVVFEVNGDGVVVHEGNYNGSGKVEYGRTISKKEVMDTITYYYTRYPEKYVLRDNPDVTDSPSGANTETPSDEQTEEPPVTIPKDSVGKKITVNNINYEITSVEGAKTVKLTGVQKGIKKVTIPSVIPINENSYKVTAINNNAFKGNKTLLEVEIGANIGSIGANAFSGCKNLKKIVIKSKSLTAKKVGKNAFKGINSNATIKVPKGKVKAYKKFIKARGAGKNVKVKE